MAEFVREQRTGDSPGRILIVEAAAGRNRRRWVANRLQQEAAPLGARTFLVSCDFESGGPWAGVSQLFANLLPEMQANRPELIEHHDVELTNILPQIRRSLKPRNASLTDVAPEHERTRNYPADRAFRSVHGLIDLLDSWKSGASADQVWIIACDDYDKAGTMSSFFFRELMRRRSERLRLRLLVGVDCRKGEAARDSLSVVMPTEMIVLDLPAGPDTVEDSATAARLASELEERIGGDDVETQIHLPELIRLWRLAGRSDKVFWHRYLGLDTYNNLGLYSDALRYGDGLLELAAQHSLGDETWRWAILLKLIMSHIGLQHVETAMKLAEEEGLKLVEHHPDWGIELYYAMAMFYARYRKPRDLVKGEEYLERGLAAIAQANLSEIEFQFSYVYNRNGLAMIRNSQGRHQEAIDLCRRGIARLNAHLGPAQHRLHRSVLVYNIAQVYAALGSHNEAIEHYSAAIAKDPNYSEYYNDRGNAFLQLGRLEEACADYLKAIELSPPYYEVFTNLGQCYRRMDAMAEAIEWYSRAIDIEPGHVLALLGRAKAHEELGHVTEAISDYTAVLARDPELWEAVASRGVMHYEAGNLHASLADFDRAIELRPGQGDLYQNRATVLTDLGRYHEAAIDLQASLLLDPSEEDRRVLEARLEAVLRPVSGEDQLIESTVS